MTSRLPLDENCRGLRTLCRHHLSPTVRQQARLNGQVRRLRRQMLLVRLLQRRAAVQTVRARGYTFHSWGGAVSTSVGVTDAEEG